MRERNGKEKGKRWEGEGEGEREERGEGGDPIYYEWKRPRRIKTFRINLKYWKIRTLENRHF